MTRPATRAGLLGAAPGMLRWLRDRNLRPDGAREAG